jgi:hypothetical protein
METSLCRRILPIVYGSYELGSDWYFEEGWHSSCHHNSGDSLCKYSKGQNYSNIAKTTYLRVKLRLSSFPLLTIIPTKCSDSLGITPHLLTLPEALVFLDKQYDAVL